MPPHPIDPLDPVVAAVIRRKAAAIARAATDPLADRDDFAQDLVLALLARRAKYDPARGVPGAFVHTVIENAAANILRNDGAEKRRRASRREKPAETCADSRQAQADEDRDLATDLCEALARMPIEPREAARLLLASLTVSEIARERRVARDTVYARVRTIRACFEHAGLQAYLRKNPSDT